MQAEHRRIGTGMAGFGAAHRLHEGIAPVMTRTRTTAAIRRLSDMKRGFSSTSGPHFFTKDSHSSPLRRER